MLRRVLLRVFFLLGGIALLSFFLGYRAVHVIPDVPTTVIEIEIVSGSSVDAISELLAEKGVISSARWFRVYLAWNNLDRGIQAGTYSLVLPMNMIDVAAALQQGFSKEREITLLPGWDLRDIGEYFLAEGLVNSREAWHTLVGKSAVLFSSGDDVAFDHSFVEEKPDGVSLEGYLAPETYRVYQHASAAAILDRLITQQASYFTPEWRDAIAAQGRTTHQVLTLASIVEREVQHPKDMARVADLFWRRLDAGWGLQADSTVHYIVGGNGSVFTSDADRETDSPWNTYKYAGLPPGPIAAASKAAIQATIFPEENDYWFFLTTLDSGEVKYGKTFAEHQRNIGRYLR